MPACRTTPRPAAIAQAAPTATTAAARNHGRQPGTASNGRAGDRCSIAHSCHASATTSTGGSARVSTASIVRWVGSDDGQQHGGHRDRQPDERDRPAVAVRDLHRRTDRDRADRGEQGREPRVRSHSGGCSLRDRESSSTKATFGVQSATTKIW